MIMDKRKVLPYLRSIDAAAARDAKTALEAQIDTTLPLATPLEISEEDAMMPAMRVSGAADGATSDSTVVFVADDKTVDEGILIAAMKAANYRLGMADIAALRARMIDAGIAPTGVEGDDRCSGGAADVLGMLNVARAEGPEGGLELTIGNGCRRAHEAVNNKAADALLIFTNEIASTDRFSILSAQTGSTASRLVDEGDSVANAADARFARCLDTFVQAMSSRKRPHASKSSSSSSSSSSSKHAKLRRSSSAQRGTPIIVLPTGANSLLTVWNVEEFLRSGRFITTQESKAQLVSSAPKDGLRFKVALPGFAEPCEFRFVDNPRFQLRKKEGSLGDWNKVVAVIANGEEWQFKGWPAGFATPADIFSRAQVRCVTDTAHIVLSTLPPVSFLVPSSSSLFSFSPAVLLVLISPSLLALRAGLLHDL